MSSLSTHVLDAVSGSPAEGVAVTAHAQGDDGSWSRIASASTDTDGRVANVHDDLEPGIYRIVFDTRAHFGARSLPTFYPEIVISFFIEEERHYHVPALISPYAYSTYRGS